MDVSGFLDEWNDPSDEMTVHTSGSTGVPKDIVVSKRRMLSSAHITCDFLGLKRGDRALLCLSVDYIAGKMMVVRSLERGLELVRVEPSNHPFAGLAESEKTFDLVAMVPSQVYCSLKVPREKRMLMKVRNLIIGGGAVSGELAFKLRDFPGAVWSTYGMTETLSHIALRRLNGVASSDWYTAFDGVSLSLADDGCLVIDAPIVCPDVLKTNDMAVLSEDGRRFRILGRKDNVICCGGVKLQIEEIEEKLGAHLKVPFCVSKRPDPKFGEIAVLLVESTASMEEVESAVSSLGKYCRPKRVIPVKSIPMTGNGKIDRAIAQEIEK